ncbi:MAG: mechanosensitive ion channel protein MscS [Rhodospirillaceae bacterium]|nr:mechanosensitive ion channel protein MscS [Rhodospirillaceae bacterium]
MDNTKSILEILAVEAVLGMGCLLLVAVCSFVLTRKVVLRLVIQAAGRTNTMWDDALVERGVVAQGSYLVPAVVVYFGLDFLSFDTEILARVVRAWFVFCLVIMLSRLLGAGADIYEHYPISNRRPIKGYIQLANLIVFLVGAILALCTLLDISPWGIMSGLGAMTALLILVFRDTILSLVASLQIAAYDIVRAGDWIEMPGLGVDGDVIDVSLHTVRVQNWDKTIITVPTHRLIQDSFKNWRGMTEAGGRRIKRSLLVDQTSIKFLDQATVDRLSQIEKLQPYLADKMRDLATANRGREGGDVPSLNRRELTNVGTFRAYAEAYLRENTSIHNEMTFMVRQLPPSSNGLPIEIYVFSNNTDWEMFEAIQADIFDHLLAALPAFELRLFQLPTGFDMRIMADGSTA